MAILVTPGQAVGQGDWEELFSQHGGFKSVQTRQPTKEEQAAADEAGLDLTQHPIYRYYLGDGSYVEAHGDDQGANYNVVAYQPSQKFQQAQAATARAAAPRTPAEQAADAKATQDQKESEANAALPKDQDPAYETTAARAARAERTIAQQRADAANARTQANVDADNKRADDAAARAAAVANRPNVIIKDDGQGGLASISTDPNTGKVTTSPVPGVRGTPQQVTVQGTVYERGADGTYAPATGIPNPNAPLPKGAPEFTPDPTDPVGDMGLTAYNHALHDAESSGLIDHTQATKLLEQATPIANAAYVHQRDQQAQATTNRGQDITQRGQTLGETQSRRSAADTGFDNAQSMYIGNAAHLGAGHGGVAAAAFREAIGLRQAYAQQAGGYADSPPVPLSPAMQSIRTTHYPDGTVVHENPGTPAAPAAAVAPAFSPPPPVGADPMAPVPGVHMTPSTSSPATVPTTSALPPADEFGRTPASGGVTPPPPPFNPPAGEPGNNPSVPVGQVPAYLQPARSAAPVFDPMSVVAELRQRGYSDAAIADAVQQHQQEMGAAA